MLNMNNRGCRQRFLHLSDLSGKIEGDSVRRVVEHYRRVTIDVFFGSTVKWRSAMCINFVNVEVTIYCRSFLCSVICVEKSLRFETDLSHLECL